MSEEVTPYPKPLPLADADGRPFWDFCRRHELRVQRCAGCGRFRWPPRGVCPNCHGWDFAWERLSGRGRVASFVVVHRAPPAFAADAPYVVAQIEPEETGSSVRLLTNVAGCAWQEVRVGMPVEVQFEDVTAEWTLPKFRP